MGSFMFGATKLKGKGDMAPRTYPLISYMGTILGLFCFPYRYITSTLKSVWRFVNTQYTFEQLEKPKDMGILWFSHVSSL